MAGRPGRNTKEEIVEKKDIDKDPNLPYGRERRRIRSQDGFHLKLHIEERFKDPRYVYRWVRGTADRIQKMESLDWEKVIDPELAKSKGSEDSTVQVYVGKLENGSPRRDILMRMPKDWFNEYQQDKLKKLEEVDEQIKQGNFKAGDIETRYIPNEVKRINNS